MYCFSREARLSLQPVRLNNSMAMIEVKPAVQILCRPRHHLLWFHRL